MVMFFTILILRCLANLILLHLSYGRTVPTPPGKHDTGATASPCPRTCTCSNQRVTCNALQLSNVPAGLPSRTKVLILNDNMKESLDFNIFSELSDIEELHLGNNRLTVVHSGGRGVLPRLKLLDLQDNPIVCDCNLVTLTATKGFVVRFGESRCTLPIEQAGRKVSDVLPGIICGEGIDRKRRYADSNCKRLECYNGGTCVKGRTGAICQCSDGFSGDQCEVRRENPQLHSSGQEWDNLILYQEDVTHETIIVSWRVTDTIDGVTSYHVSLESYDQRLDPPWSIWTHGTRYTFIGLQPAAEYKVCVTAYSYDRKILAQNCDHYRTLPYPSHPNTGDTDSGMPWGSRDPTSEDQNDDMIQKAAVILGSVIGVCALLIIFLSLGYKLHTLRSGHSHSEDSPNHSQPATTETTPDASTASNPTREIIVLAVTSNENQTAPPVAEGDASAPQLVSEAATGAPNAAALNSVLQALQQDSDGHQGTGAANTMVLYSPDNNGTGDVSGAASQENPSGNAPIYILSNGNRYPLDSTQILSEVLRSAIVGTSTQPAQVPNEPPPPYSEREDTNPPSADDDDMVQDQQCENTGYDNVSFVQSLDET